MNGFHPTRRQFLFTASAAALSAWGFRRGALAEEPAPELPGVPVSKTYSETSSQLAIKDPSRFKVLQLTDAHMHQPRVEVPNAYERTIAEWKQQVERYKPDLIAVTGDFWHENPDGRGEEFMHDCIAQVSGLGTPWCYTWGNHDKLNDYPKGHDAFHDAKHSLYRGGATGGNYMIDIIGPNKKPVWEFICMNTHTGGLPGPSHAWLEQFVAGRKSVTGRPPAIALLHIPIKQYLAVRSEADTAGIFLDSVSSQKEDGSTLDLLKSLGTVRACVCGHNHKNDYSGMADEVELIFGRSSGWAAYGWVEVRKGAKLFTINCETKQYRWETVFPDGLTWRPKAGDKIEQVLDVPWMKDPQAQPKAA